MNYYVNNLDFLEEMVKFLEIHNLQRSIHEEIESMNRPIAAVENKAAVKAF